MNITNTLVDALILAEDIKDSKPVKSTLAAAGNIAKDIKDSRTVTAAANIAKNAKDAVTLTNIERKVAAHLEMIETVLSGMDNTLRDLEKRVTTLEKAAQQ